MGWIQTGLLVIGMTALGTVLGFGSLLFGLSALEPKGGEWRGFGALLAGFFCGAPLGGIVGLAGVLWWVRNYPPRDSVWGPGIWAGAGLGLAGGLVLDFHWGLDQARGWNWLAAAVIALATATLGGLVFQVAQHLWRRVMSRPTDRPGRQGKSQRARPKKPRRPSTNE